MNNRQNNRRRGRNPTVRQGGGGRGADPQNRIDNRTRGNAVQLHEKYRNMARDAQTKGDRVEAEYWWQFADHYYRVVADQRARAEERQGGGRSQRDEWRAQAEEDDDRQPSSQGNDRDDGDDWRREARGGSQGNQQGDRGRGDDRFNRSNGRADEEDSTEVSSRQSVAMQPSDADEAQHGDTSDRSTRRPRRARPVEATVGEEQPIKRPRGRPRKVVEPDAQLDSEVLPPSISADGEVPRRRGRPRKVVDEGTAAA